MVSLREVAVTAALGGLVCHPVVKRHEPRFTNALALVASATLGVFLVNVVHLQLGVVASIAHTAVAFWSFFASLFTSIAVYRLFLHPLNAYPGPIALKLSKIPHAWTNVKGKQHLYIAELHERYGDVVRIGPNELSIRNADAIDDVLGFSTKLNKAPWTDAAMQHKGNSLFGLKDIHEHAIRRRVWDRAFSSTALQSYSVYVKNRTEELIQQLKARKDGVAINIRDWMTFAAFDLMGDLGIGQSFGMLDNGTPHWYIHVIEESMYLLSIFTEVPWLASLFEYLPMTKGMRDMYDLSTTMREKRMKAGMPAQPDLWSYITGEIVGEKTTMTGGELDADMRLIIIAGSDTTASTMTFALEYLSRNPQWLKALQDEVEPLRPRLAEVSDQEIGALPILNAIINETLRTRPVVPSKSPRVTPPAGMSILGKFIPGNTSISVPIRAIHLDQRNFDPSPQLWRPERWLHPENELVFKKKAFSPFSAGPYGCAGKKLAYLEARFILASIALNFDLEPAPEHDGAAFEDSIRDCFTVQFPPVMMLLKPRSGQ